MRCLKSISILFLFAALMVMVKPAIGCNLASGLTPHNHAHAWMLQKLLSKRKQEMLAEEMKAEQVQLGARKKTQFTPTDRKNKTQCFAAASAAIPVALRLSSNSLPAPPPLYLLLHRFSI